MKVMVFGLLLFFMSFISYSYGAEVEVTEEMHSCQMNGRCGFNRIYCCTVEEGRSYCYCARLNDGQEENEGFIDYYHSMEQPDLEKEKE